MFTVFAKRLTGLCGGVALLALSNSTHASSSLITLNASSNANTNSLVGTNTAINFTATGQPYVFYPNTDGSNGAAATPDEKSSASTAFGKMTDTLPSGAPSGRSSTSGAGYSAFTATIAVADGTPASSFTDTGYTYISTSPSTPSDTTNVGKGLTITYSVPALTTETINVLVYTQSNPNVRMLISDATGTIYDDGAAGITLNNTGVGGSYKGGGIYSVNLTNTSASPDPLTFSYTFAGYTNEAASTVYLGLDAAYVTVAPEPAAIGLLALGGCGMLLRRRRSGARA